MVDENILRKVQDHAVNGLSWSKSSSTNLHIQREELREGTVIAAHPPAKGITMKRNSIMVFADDEPMLSWGHACRYLLYDARNGELYDEVAGQLPPYLVKEPASFVGFYLPLRRDAPGLLWPIRPPLGCPRSFPAGERYAILFSGASNASQVNDLEFLYRTMRHQYGFKAANITCLVYDGTINYGGPPHPVGSWPGDNTPYQMPVNGPGTRAALDQAFDALKAKLKPADLLLIHLNGHSSWQGPGQSCLLTFSGPAFFAADLGARLATLPPHHTLMAVYQPCYSAGFNAPTVANSKAKYTTVASSTLETQSSNMGIPFNPFIRNWVSAMAGHTPTGTALAFDPDLNHNGRVSALEAFTYADVLHQAPDSPVFSRNVAAADDTFLGQRYVWWWSWWCPIIVKYAEPIYRKMPIPEFYERWNGRLGPMLAPLAEELERTDAIQRKTVEATLKKVVEEALR